MTVDRSAAPAAIPCCQAHEILRRKVTQIAGGNGSTIPRPIANLRPELGGLLNLTDMGLQVDIQNKLIEANVRKSTMALYA